jgi:hypothetical protein
MYAPTALTTSRNTIETWSIGLSSQRSATQLLSRNTDPQTEQMVSPHSDRVPDWPGNDNMTEDTYQAPQSYVDDIFNRLDPQLWLTPSPSGWNQWDSLLNSIPMPSCVA